MREGFVEKALGGVADRFGLEHGQAYTVAAGVVLALLLGVFGLPPVLDDGSVASASAAAPAADAPAPPTTVPRVVTPGPIPAPTTVPAPEPSPAAAPPTSVSFRPPPPAPSRQPTTAPTTTAPPGPRLPIPATPAGTTTVFARVPTPGAPEGVGIGPDGTVYVATNNGGGRGGVGPSEIVAFSAEGRLLGSFAVTGQPEDRTNGLTGLAVDTAGRVVVADASTGRLLRLDPSRSELTELVTIPDIAPCLVVLSEGCEPGTTDNAPELRSIVIADDGAILVADRGQGVVWRYESGDPTIAVTVADRAPGEGPTGVALRGDEIIVTVSEVADPLPTGISAVISYSEGGGTVLATYELADGLAGVVVGASGNLFVSLAGTNAIDVIGPDGPLTTYDGGGVSPAFDSPTGLALGDEFLLVTNQSSFANDPTRWVVHHLVVTDRPTAS